MTDTSHREELLPTRDVLREATMKSLGQRCEAAQVEEFLQRAAGAQTPSPIGATASVDIAIWGKCTCDPDGQSWRYDQTVWGGPAFFGSSTGFMYTAYDSWDAFFRNVTSVHCQGIAEAGGILQINWFNGDGTPVGQYNGVAGGIGLLEAGGSGGWQRK